MSETDGSDRLTAGWARPADQRDWSLPVHWWKPNGHRACDLDDIGMSYGGTRTRWLPEQACPLCWGIVSTAALRALLILGQPSPGVTGAPAPMEPDAEAAGL